MVLVFSFLLLYIISQGISELGLRGSCGLQGDLISPSGVLILYYVTFSDP